MKYKQILTLREIRLWATMVIPATIAGIALLANNPKVKEGVEKVKGVFKKDK